MGQLLNLISKFKALNTDQVIEASLTEVAPQISEEQKKQLLYGQSSQGDPLPQYKNKSYAIKKNQINPLPGLGVPDLKLFGSFQEGIFTEVDNGGVFISSSDSKLQELGAHYGLDVIFGLNKKSKTEIINEVLRPVFLTNIRNQVGL